MVADAGQGSALMTHLQSIFVEYWAAMLMQATSPRGSSVTYTWSISCMDIYSLKKTLDSFTRLAMG
jgi:hypothetical protein